MNNDQIKQYTNAKNLGLWQRGDKIWPVMPKYVTESKKNNWATHTLAGSIDFWISPHGIATVCAWYDCLWVGKMYLHIHTLDDLHVDLNLTSKNLLSIQIQSWNPDFHFLFYIFKLPSSNSSFILNSDLFTKFEKLPEFVLHPVAWTVVCRKHLVISF